MSGSLSFLVIIIITLCLKYNQTIKKMSDKLVLCWFQPNLSFYFDEVELNNFYHLKKSLKIKTMYKEHLPLWFYII